MFIQDFFLPSNKWDALEETVTVIED